MDYSIGPDLFQDGQNSLSVSQIDCVLRDREPVEAWVAARRQKNASVHADVGLREDILYQMAADKPAGARNEKLHDKSLQVRAS
jgi:hypothetical protein